MSESRADRVAATTARLRELATKFLLRSAADLDAMRRDLIGLGGGDVTALANIHHVAHRMCGTGATLGFEALSDCARRIEKLAEAQPPDARLAPSSLHELATELEILAAEVSRNHAAKI